MREPRGAVDTLTRVFISYAHQDLDFATRLATALAAEGVEPWIDREGIHAGDA